MTQSREIELNAGSPHLRQFPLNGARVARICKMTETQAKAIRDPMNYKNRFSLCLLNLHI